MIKTLNNFLPKDLQDEIESTMLSMDFGWYYYPSTADKNLSHTDENVKDSFHFTHTVYFYDTGINSSYYGLIKKVLDYVQKSENIKVKNLLRIKANFTTPQPNYNIHNYQPIHPDEYSKNMYSFLYYVNDSDGDTRFFDQKFKLINSCTPKKGTGALFKATTFHAGSCPVNYDKRLVINFVFEVEND